MIWNPWKRIAQLETEVAMLSDQLDYERYETRRAISDSVYHGIEREVYRRRQLEAQNALLKQHMLEVSSFTMPNIVLSRMGEE